MKWLTHSKRLAIYLRDGLRCLWCGCGVEHGATLALDHVRPHTKGGSNHERNLITSCVPCNRRRQNKTAREFARTFVDLPEVTPLERVEAIEAIVGRIERHTRRKLAKYRKRARAILRERKLSDITKRHVPPPF